MTIQEAIKSGKKYKRQIFQIWRRPNENHTFTIPDVLADDWEIDQEPREIWLVRVNGIDNDVVFYEEEDAINSELATKENAKVIKFQEVIE